MNKISPEEEEKRKKAIFESMSSRRQKHILKKGYENWDPFQEPKDPIDIKQNEQPSPLFGSFYRQKILKNTAMHMEGECLNYASVLSIMMTGTGECMNFRSGTGNC